jgi:hypothetical protein
MNRDEDRPGEMFLAALAAFALGTLLLAMALWRLVVITFRPLWRIAHG